MGDTIPSHRNSNGCTVGTGIVIKMRCYPCSQVKERPASATGAAWADEFAVHQQRPPAAGSQWADEFDGNPGQRWLGQFGAEQRNDDVSRWADDFATEMSSVLLRNPTLRSRSALDPHNIKHHDTRPWSVHLAFEGFARDLEGRHGPQPADWSLSLTHDVMPASQSQAPTKPRTATKFRCRPHAGCAGTIFQDECRRKEVYHVLRRRCHDVGGAVQRGRRGLAERVWPRDGRRSGGRAGMLHRLDGVRVCNHTLSATQQQQGRDCLCACFFIPTNLLYDRVIFCVIVRRSICSRRGRGSKDMYLQPRIRSSTTLTALPRCTLRLLSVLSLLRPPSRPQDVFKTSPASGSV
jgi:hypothetical protein